MNKKLNKVYDIFQLEHGDIVSKRNLMDLIQYSKVKDSIYWTDEYNIINNTPQQGINWIGKYPDFKGLILKTKKGAYDHDGWNTDKSEFKYAFKASNGVVNPNEKANLALTEQPNLKYPIFLFVENKNTWIYEGRFDVYRILRDHVILKALTKNGTSIIDKLNHLSEAEFEEGERKLKTHYVAERNKKVVKLLKSTNPNICEICKIDFESKYGFKYIEAHHKNQLSNIKGKRKVHLDDFALLCPNCHKVVHLFMANSRFSYNDINLLLKEITGK